MNKNGIIKSY